jgi:predicted ATPase
MAPAGEYLVGRTDELGLIGAALDALSDGRPAVLELVGEPGIGKTRLLGEIARRADERGQLVLSGSASELERDVPFWVFVDALDEYLRGLDPARLAGLGDDVRADLALVMPSLSGLSPQHDVAAQHERYRSHRAVRELLATLADEQPVVLILDDLHWGDPASTELLGTLVHRPPSAPVLLAFAVRPRQLPQRLLTALERGHRNGSVTRVELAALTREESDRLLGADIGQPDAASLYEDSGGNPFYLEQLARMLERGGSAPTPAPDLSLGGVHVPPIVAAALAEELDLLSDHARLVLEGASVAGDPFDPELGAAAADTSSATAMTGGVRWPRQATGSWEWASSSAQRPRSRPMARSGSSPGPSTSCGVSAGASKLARSPVMGMPWASHRSPSASSRWPG